jgi:hypothetical protein
VANKVQTIDGRWLSIDGRVLFKANVAASETYNTALEQHLRDSLGVRFAERPGTDPAKRPIRDIAHSTEPSGDARFEEQRAAHTALSRWHGPSQGSYQTPGQRPNGPAAPGR